MRPYFFLFPLVALLGVAGFVRSRSGREPVTVDAGDIKVSMLGRAIVGPADGTAEVRAEVEGRVTRVLVRVGDKVKAGDLLAELDKATFELEVARRTAEVRALTSSKRSIAEGARPEDRAMAQAELAAATAELAFAEQRAKRAAVLAASGATSPSDSERESNALSLAKAGAAGAEARLRRESGVRASDVVSAEARVEAAEAALRQATTDLARVRVVAPIDGVVLARRVNVGDAVRSGSPPAFEIADVSRLEVRVEIGEDDGGQLVPGLPSRLTRSDQALVATGHVGRVSAQLEARSVGFDESRLRGDARVRVAWIELDGAPTQPLILGQVLEAELTLPARKVAARLPRDAVKVVGGRAVVEAAWGSSGGLFTREVPIKVGIADDHFVEVTGVPLGASVLVR